jgi:hypothetical protein
MFIIISSLLALTPHEGRTQTNIDPSCFFLGVRVSGRPFNLVQVTITDVIQWGGDFGDNPDFFGVVTIGCSPVSTLKIAKGQSAG